MLSKTLFATNGDNALILSIMFVACVFNLTSLAPYPNALLISSSVNAYAKLSAINPNGIELETEIIVPS